MAGQKRAEHSKVKQRILFFETAFLQEKTVKKKSKKKDCKKVRNSEKKYFSSRYFIFFPPF
jgi:hypothetical protein